MTTDAAKVHEELSRRHRSATLVVFFFLGLDVFLLLIAYFTAARIYRPGVDPKTAMGLWIAILVCGLGVFVLRRTRFSAMRLKDIAALKGVSALLRTLQGTTIQLASIAGAVALMGFMITIITADWTNMLRAGGVAAIILFYCYPFKSAWQRAVKQLGPSE